MTFKSTFQNLFLFLILNAFCLKITAQLNVTVNQKAGQSTNHASPVVFTAVFSAPINVATFTAARVVLSGTAPGMAVSAITQVAPNNGTTFEITATATSNTGTILASIPASGAISTIFVAGPFGPNAIIIDASGNLYTSSGDRKLYKVTPAGVLTTIVNSSNSYGITMDGSGNWYSANYTNNSVSKVTPAGVLSSFANTGAGTIAITIDGSGNIYTANYTANNVNKITPAGVVTVFGTTGSGPQGMSIDGSGNIYTTNVGDNTVSKITSAGVSTSAFATVGSWPQSSLPDGAGNLYVTNFNDNTISKITSAGVSSIFATTGAGPYGIAKDGAGNFYVTNSYDNNVSKISSAGISSILGTTGSNPNGIVIDGSGNLFTVNKNDNNISKLVPFGIAPSGSTIPSNNASTSTNNTYTLPVTLVSFTATNQNCTTTLNWQTSAEINNGYYAIEKSADGQAFEFATKLAGKNSALGANYRYSFTGVANGTIYYRLKIVDIDGHYTYSKTVAVTTNGNCNTGVALVTVSPNPAKDFITINGVVGGSSVSLINASGIRLVSLQATGSSQRIDISRYAKGIYTLRVEAVDGSVQTIKVVK